MLRIKKGEVKILSGIFQEDALSPILFVISMTALSLIIKKYPGGNKFTQALGKINHLIYMDNIKLKKNWRP